MPSEPRELRSPALRERIHEGEIDPQQLEDLGGCSCIITDCIDCPTCTTEGG